MKYSAEERIAAVLEQTSLDAQTAVDDLRQEMAVFALFIWVAIARRVIAESKKPSFGFRTAVASMDTMLNTKFRRYEGRLTAQLQGILAAQRVEIQDGIVKITGDVKYAKTAKVDISRVNFMTMTIHQTFSYLLQQTRQRMVLAMRNELIGASPRFIGLLGSELKEAERLHDSVGGEFGDVGSPSWARAAARVARGVPKIGAVHRLSGSLYQTASDFTYAGLVDTALPMYSKASTTENVAAVVVQDDRTGAFCTRLIGGVWSVATGKPTADSRVSIDFPGPPPYHPDCRTKQVPVFHKGLVFPSGIEASGEAPKFSKDRPWRGALLKD